MVKDTLYYSRQFKRRRFLRRLFFLLLIVGILAGGIIYFFRAPYFRVKNIEIGGLSELNGLARVEVAREVGALISGNTALVFPHNNMFILSTEYLAENLSQRFLDIKDFVVARQWPSGLKISGSERATWAIYCQAPVLSKSEAIGYKTQSSELLRVVNSCFLVDNEGRLFSGAPDFQGDLLLKIYDERKDQFNAGDFVLNRDNFLAMVGFIAQLEHDLNDHISRIILKESGTKEFHLKDWYVLTDNSVDYKIARNNLNLAISEIGDKRDLLDYIDLRFSNKIFYKLR